VTRPGAALALELRVQWRYRIPAVALIVTLVWTVALLAMPAPLAGGVGPVILTIDTATFGSFFIAALVLFERGEGALAALSVSPLRFGEYLTAKVATLTGLSLGSAIPITLVAGRGQANLGLALLAVALLSVLFLVVSFALVVRHRTITGFLTVAPLPLAPLIAAPLVHLSGIADHPALYLVPSTGAADLIRLAINLATPIPPGRTAAVLGYLILAIAIATLVARRRFNRELVGRTYPPATWSTRFQPAGRLTALLHIDARTTLRSALLIIVLTGPILLALALRLGYPPLASYVQTRFGFDLTPYQPILLAALVVLHVPLITGMVGALLILDDIDDHKVLILRTSPVTLPRYLAYRAISVAAVTAILLAIAVPVCGLAPWPAVPSLLPALVLAAAQAPLITLATAALAGNKVEGLAWLKILGLLPTGIAPAMWWLPDPAQWPLRAFPHYWTVDTLWHPTLPGLLAGAALTALATALLARRTLHRLTGG
jgi:fluoroquinolone transport system permease protein